VHDKPRDTVGYSTDQITNRTLAYIEDSVKAKKPFFITAAPVAPHVGIIVHPDGSKTGVQFPIPKTEYDSLFPNLTVPRHQNFNPSKVGDFQATVYCPSYKSSRDRESFTSGT
jgi:hypothetical protein